MEEWLDAEREGLDKFPFDSVKIIGKMYYLTNSTSYELNQAIRLKPVSVGIFLGEKKKNFIPSMALIEMLNPYAKASITIKTKSAWLFACGRDVFDNSIITKKGKGKNVFVLNDKGDVYGYAKKEKDQGKTIFTNLLDIGIYLRREQRGKKKKK